MPTNSRKLQQKKERRNKKSKEKRTERNRAVNVNPFALLAAAADAPFLHCAIDRDAFTAGIGTMLVARLLPKGMAVGALFLVDMYCLGIKDAFWEFGTRFELDALAKQVQRGRVPAVLSPADAKALVTGAAAYAAGFGLPPAEDYAKVLPIFTGVDPAGATLAYEFGKDGKPLYVCGPNDNAAFQARVLATLRRTAGPGGYNFLTEIESFQAGRWAEYADEEGGAESDDLQWPIRN